MAASEIYREDYGADKQKTIDFSLRSEHIRLLRRMWAGWLDYAGVVGINSKYPLW